MTYDGIHHYAYDAENRISNVDSGSTASYTYDAQGRRTAKEAATYYVYDLSGHVMSEYGNCQTCWTVGYIYVKGGLAAMYENSTTFFVHPDHLGSTRLMTAYPTPSIYDCHDYYPFGELIACGSTGGTTHKFTDKERDTESNLDNFGARYMASTLGRFMSPDPANAGANSTNPQSWNMYSYVLNSPLLFTDPTGLGPCEEDNDDPSCAPGTGNGFGYSTYPQPIMNMDSHIPIPLPGTGDDCGSNPTLPGCPTGQDLKPASGCAFFDGGMHCWGGGFSGAQGPQLFQSRDPRPAPAPPPTRTYFPWVISWVIPIAPVPGLGGVGPAGDFEFNPATGTVCGGLGIGASGGKNVAGGPLSSGKMFGGRSYPEGADDILSGTSLSIGYNTPILLGVQGLVNTSGMAYGVTGGVPGVGATVTYSVCSQIF
jgi:RHS repeat-associated protein